MAAKEYGEVKVWAGCQCAQAKPFCSGKTEEGHDMCIRCAGPKRFGDQDCRMLVTKRTA